MLKIQDLNDEKYRWMSDSSLCDDGFDRRKRSLQQLQAFIGPDADVSLLHLINPDFLTRFARYLYDTHCDGSNQATIERWLGLFQRMLRDGIRNGYLPNYDPMTKIRQRLVEEYGASEEKAKVDNRNASNHDFAAEVAKLVSLISSATALLRLPSDDKFAVANGVGDCKWGGKSC